MRFDPVTKQFYGKIRDITPEEEAFFEEQVRKGVMVSTGHPSEEDIEAAKKWRSEHTFNEGAGRVFEGKRVLAMSKGYQFTYDEVMSYMEEAYSCVSEFCKYEVDLLTNPRTDDGKTVFDPLHPVGAAGYTPMEITVGTKSLVDNRLPSGAVRDEDAVWVLQQVYHESAHVWQYSVGYMRENASMTIKAMARDRAIGICFPEYVHAAYGLDTTEIFADMCAVSEVKRFFDRKAKYDTRFCDVDVDNIVCASAAKQRSDVFPKFLQCKTSDDVYNVYAKGLDCMMYQKKFDVRNMTKRRPLSEPLSRFLHIRNRNTFLQIVNSQNGKEESELLCKYIGRYYPSCMRSLICIQKDYGVLNFQNVNERALRMTMGVRPLPSVNFSDSAQADDEYEF